MRFAVNFLQGGEAIADEVLFVAVRMTDHDAAAIEVGIGRAAGTVAGKAADFDRAAAAAARTAGAVTVVLPPLFDVEPVPVSPLPGSVPVPPLLTL
jgi:hypothetical protein